MLAVLLISAAPVTLRATPGAVLLTPTRLFKASINKVPESKLVLVVPSLKILKKLVPSAVICQVSLLSFHCNRELAELPRLISMPAFSVGGDAPGKSAFNVIILSLISNVCVLTYVLVPVTVKFALIVTSLLNVVVPVTAKVFDRVVAPVTAIVFANVAEPV